MATPQVLTPPVTPRYNDLDSKQNHRTRYKRIRFKNWQPERAASQEGATNNNGGKRRDHKPHSPAPDAQTVAEQISDSEFEVILRRAITSHPASPLSTLPTNGTRMDPFTELPIKADGIVPATLDYCKFIALF